MVELQRATIHRYKCFFQDTQFHVEPDITVLVGENDTGKTSALEALSKANYFNRNDNQFSYAAEKDYPRSRKKELNQGGRIPDAVTLEYGVSEELTARIVEEMLLQPEYPGFCRTTDYAGKCRVSENGFAYVPERFWETYTIKRDSRLKGYIQELCEIRSMAGLERLIQQCNSVQDKTSLRKLERFFENRMHWENPLSEYVYRTYLLPEIPRFLYYDEYYMLPSRVSLNRIATGKELTPSENTVRALLLLADVDAGKLLSVKDDEDIRVLLEQMSRDVTSGFLEYWATNHDLRVEFALVRDEINKEKADPGNSKQKENRKKHFWSFLRQDTVSAENERKENETTPDMWMEIRVYDIRNMVSLPVGSRSKGFNWFLSFYVWFMAMEKTMDGNCVFLLDEPGQNLHATAEKDLIRLLKHLANRHQVIFTTHSASMTVGQEWTEKIRCIQYTPTGTDIVSRKKDNWETEHETIRKAGIKE